MTEKQDLLQHKYLYQVSDSGREWCDVYALPNGSVPLKKSVIRLVVGVFNLTQFKYGDLRRQRVAVNMAQKWFPPHAWEGYNLADAFYKV